MPSVKRRFNSVSGRHHDDRLRNSTDVSEKVQFPFFYQVDTEIAEVRTDIARSFLKTIRSLLP